MANSTSHAAASALPGSPLPWRVIKFGGTSVTGPERLTVIEGVVRARREVCRPMLVVSALSGVTRLLTTASERAAAGDATAMLPELEAVHRQALVPVASTCPECVRDVEARLGELAHLLRGVSLVGECSPRTMDQVLSLGERMSARIVAGELEARGVTAYPMDAADLIVTDGHHGQAEVDFPATREKVGRAGLDRTGVPVVTGFTAATSGGTRTTLGRGGSDYSAAVLGWALDAQEVEIWTDVDGVLTADPSTVPEARPLRGLGYAELLELSHWGARVVHPKTVRPLRERGIPLVIRNTFSPEDQGTRVAPHGDDFPSGPVRGIASIGEVSLLQLTGFGRGGTSVAARLLDALDGARVQVLLVSQGCGERSVCIALPSDSLTTAEAAIAQEFDLERRAGLLDDPVVERGCSIVAVVGAGMKDRPGIAGTVFAVLGAEEVNVRAIAQGSSELNISFVVRAVDAARAERAVHTAFFSPRPGEQPTGQSAGAAAGMGAAAQEAAPGAGPAGATSTAQHAGAPGAATPATEHAVDAAAAAAHLAGGDLDVVRLTRDLVDIPSVSGDESAITGFVGALLERLGWKVTRQQIDEGRENVWASSGRGEVTLSTHLDTVPGFPTPRFSNGDFYGRGACDAKGIASAMICAAERLRGEGEDRVDLLFVIGEEVGSVGARAARLLPATSRWLVNGEPTEGKLGSAAKGALRVVVHTRGVEAHSAYSGVGRSAIHAMVDLLGELPSLDLPTDPILGPTLVNVGTVTGGTAANVSAGGCEAELMIRLVGDDEPVRATFEAWAEGRADLAWGSHVPPQHFHVLDGFEEGPVGYTSDAGLLSNWGTPLLYGPGSIHVAHSDQEHISLHALRRGVDDYARIASALLAS